jgi:signal transduction histidine kinase
MQTLQQQLKEKIACYQEVTQELDKTQQLLTSQIQNNEALNRQVQTQDSQLKSCRSRLQELNARLDSSEKILALGKLSAGLSGTMDSSVAFVRGNIEGVQRYISALREVFVKQSAFIDRNKSKGRLLRSYVGELEAITRDVDMPGLLRDIDLRIDESLDAMGLVTKTINDLNYFSPVRSGYFVEDDVQRALEKAITMAQREMPDGLEIRREYSEVPRTICDVEQLQHAFYHLIQNAFEAMPHQGMLTLRLGAQSKMVWIDVADTGVGIAEHNRDKIFNLFFSSKSVRGAGVGLYLVRRVVDEHAGSVVVQPQVNSGATFRIILPVKGPSN